MAKEPAAKTTPLGVRVSVETKAALDRAAKDEIRSTASLVEWVLVNWLRERGYLTKDGDRK